MPSLCVPYQRALLRIAYRVRTQTFGAERRVDDTYGAGGDEFDTDGQNLAAPRSRSLLDRMSAMPEKRIRRVFRFLYPYPQILRGRAYAAL